MILNGRIELRRGLCTQIDIMYNWSIASLSFSTILRTRILVATCEVLLVIIRIGRIFIRQTCTIYMSQVETMSVRSTAGKMLPDNQWYDQGP